ncbi:MAG: DUF1385 domain-containing protein [Chloroflexi bacterium]|nr:DUF1385 domain-containing protein [Chloroflexota bacterium]
MSEKLPNYGGQAVIEGVMMRGKRSVAMAMRAPDGKIQVYTESLGGIYQSSLAKIPFLRGLVILWDTLGLGIRFLTISANTQTGEDEKLEGPMLYITLSVSLVLGVGLFILLPAGLGQLAGRLFSWNHWITNLLEGVIRLALLVGYIWGVGKMPDLARVFAYHGAEHKTINAYEAGVELFPANVARYSVEHPRCGTAFLLTLILISIVIFSLLGPLPLGIGMLYRIVLLPVLAGLAYEFIRWTADHLKSPIVRLIVRPNLALQHLTTREPTLEMIEVAITAFNTMIAQES